MPPASLTEIEPRGNQSYIRKALDKLFKGQSDLTAIVAIGYWPNGPWTLVVTKDLKNTEYTKREEKASNALRHLGAISCVKRRIYAAVYMGGKKAADGIKAELDKAHEFYLGSASDMQAMLEAAIADTGKTFWDHQKHCRRVEENALVLEREDLRK